MKIDKTTLLFSEMSYKERVELFEYAEDVVLRGKLPRVPPTWVAQWFEAAGFDDRQGLLVVSTVLPQRILLSLLKEPEDVAKSGPVVEALSCFEPDEYRPTNYYHNKKTCMCGDCTVARW